MAKIDWLPALEQDWLALLGSVGGFGVGWWARRLRHRSGWSKRHFLDRLMVSLNGIREEPDGRRVLTIRTLFEVDLQEVFRNQVARDQVSAKAEETTLEDPILPLEEEDRWFILNAILNEVAERYSMGSVMADLGLETRCAPYLIALTREKAGEVRTQKIRAMVVRKDRLLNGAFQEALSFERASHAPRLDTLEAMRKRYLADPEALIEVELALGR